MKTQLKRIILCTSICLTAAAAFAQAGAGYGVLRSSSSSGTNQPTSTREARQSRQFAHAKNVVGATVKDPQGQRLGDVYDLVFNPQKGETFAAIDLGNGIYALVPSQTLTIVPGTGILSRKAHVTLNATKAALQSGPTVKNDEWRRLDTPGFTQNIYAHYQVQAPSAMGGAGADSLGGVSGGRGGSTNQISKPTTPQR